MKRIVSAPRSQTARRLLAGGALMGVLLAAGAAAIGDVSPEAKRSGAAASRSLSLFSGPKLELSANQWQCGLDSEGNVCTNIFNSPTGAGGNWPIGTPNAYIFNTGMQVGGISADGAYDWANDTLGAFFFDASGTHPSGSQVTNIYNSLDPADLCGDADGDGFDDCWGQADYSPSKSFPTLEDLYITNADLYEENLLGRANISQQDSWVQYWDGDPTRITDRQHPMGLLITQRSLAWNYPLGNEAVLYFIYEIRNVTNTPEFQLPNELAFFSGDPAGIPDEGITYNEVYAGFSTDMDVADAGSNFSTAILPFDLGISYHGGFDAPTFSYTPSIFFPPFFTTAPGIVGVKYLKSPVNPATGEEVGLTRFSITLNGGPPGSVGDPANDKQLWRYHSGFLNPALGDAPCSVAPEVDTGQPSTTEQSVCFVYQDPFDTRFFQSSGPFTLAPGQQVTVVVAYLAAATVQTMPDGSLSGISANAAASANPPGTPSFHPGYPSARGCDASGNNCTVVDAVNAVKPLEKGAGWAGYSGPAPSGRADGALDGPENKLPVFDENGTPYVSVVQGSLLGKALVAQTIFDNKFLLGFAPVQPNFYLVPGNNQVTVLWDRSITEEVGDPFFAVAGDSTSALYNPNYRSNDVEAYAIWRNAGQTAPELVAFFDYANTTYTDVTCETVLPDEDLHDNSSAPTGTIGYVAGEECPEDFSKGQSIDQNMYFNNGSIGGGPGGGVVRLADSTALGTNLTQVSVDNFEGFPAMTNTGVPFAYVDASVTNNFTYFYSVQAIDINSLASGPYSLSSSNITTRVTPRNDSQNLTEGSFEIYMADSDGVPLEYGSIPTINTETGIFSGPFPPTEALDLDLQPVVERLLGQGVTEAVIDSIQIRATGNLASGTQEFPPSETCTNNNDPSGRIASEFGACWVAYLTATLPDGSSQQTEMPGWHPWWNAFGSPGTVSDMIVAATIPFDPEALESFDIPEGSTSGIAIWKTGEAQNNTAAEGAQNRRRGHYATGARWFDGAVNTIEDPSRLTRVGHVEAADTIFAPIPYTPIEGGGAPVGGFDKQCFNRGMAFNDRAADVSYTWGGGTVGVYDETHNVPVSFSPRAGPTWGFLTTDANGNGVIDWHDFNYIDGALEILRQVDGGNCNDFAGDRFDADLNASPVSLVSTPSLVPTSTAGMDITVDLENGAALPATGTGFGLYAYGHRFIFEMSSLPGDGTVWTLRTFKGELVTDDDAAENPTGYTYIADGAGGGDPDGGPLPMMIPGLKFVWNVIQGETVFANFDLSGVHTVPDPYLATSQYDAAPTSKNLQFVNLPPEATIRIYTLTGVLVAQIDHKDSTGGGRAVWDIRNWSQQFVASGVYFFHVVTPEGDERVGKFTIVNFAGQN